MLTNLIKKVLFRAPSTPDTSDIPLEEITKGAWVVFHSPHSFSFVVREEKDLLVTYYQTNGARRSGLTPETAQTMVRRGHWIRAKEL